MKSNTFDSMEYAMQVFLLENLSALLKDIETRERMGRIIRRLKSEGYSLSFAQSLYDKTVRDPDRLRQKLSLVKERLKLLSDMRTKDREAAERAKYSASSYPVQQNTYGHMFNHTTVHCLMHLLGFLFG